MKEKLIALALTLTLLSVPSLALAVTTNIPASAQVTKYIAVTFSYATLDFGSVVSPSTDNKPINFNQVLGQLNVSTDTNYDYIVKIRGTNFAGPQTIAITNMEAKCSATLTDIVNKVAPLTLLTTDQTCYTKTVTSPGVQPLEYNGYWLDIPTGVLAGSYTSTITLTHSNI